MIDLGGDVLPPLFSPGAPDFEDIRIVRVHEQGKIGADGLVCVVADSYLLITAAFPKKLASKYMQYALRQRRIIVEDNRICQVSFEHGAVMVHAGTQE
jgi:hypothetical protein